MPRQRKSNRRDSESGISLVASSGKAFRIAKTKYGARNPMSRDGSTSRMSWGRWDAVHASTIYGATSYEAAFAEVLAPLRPASRRTPLWTIFDDVGPEDKASLEEQIVAESPGMRHGHVPKVWRLARSKYELRLPKEGWFVDIQTSDSLAAIRRALAPSLASIGVEDLTLSELTGPRKDLTTMVATWIHSLVLDDGSVPHGIRYASKHGTDWHNWAIWLRRVDDGHHVDTEPTYCSSAEEIPHNDPDLRKIAGRWGMRVF